jgi:predicted exporter
VAVVLVALGVAGYGAVRGSHDGIYEMRLLALRNRESLRTGSASWDEKMNQLFGSWVNPVVALVEKPEDREPAAAELRRVLRDGDTALVDRVETIEAVLPSPVEQKRRIDRLKRLSDTLAALPDDALDDNARKLAKTHLAPERMQPIRVAEIPGLLVQGFREADGDLTRTVLIYPTLRIDYGDGVNMQRLAAKLQDAQLPQGAMVGGAFLFMSDIIRLVHEQAPRVVGTVCVLVGLVLLPFFWRRPGRIALVLGTVVPVALVSQAMLLAADVRINMLNFAAVPITIGVGADYVLNLLGAMDSLKTDARNACVRMGGAILLCSSTTIVGYASLLAAQSGALRTFGWSAVLGEIIATAVVLLVLPMLLGARPAPAPGADPLAAEVDLRAPSQ